MGTQENDAAGLAAVVPEQRSPEEIGNRLSTGFDFPGSPFDSPLSELLHLTLGAASLAAGAVEQALNGGTDGTSVPQPLAVALDLMVGMGLTTYRVASRSSRAVATIARPIAAPLRRRLLGDGRNRLALGFRELTERGRKERNLAERNVRLVSRTLAARLVPLVLDEIDLTQEVVKRVDLDAVIKSVDLDAAAADIDLEQVVRRIDVDGIVASVDLAAIVDRLPIDRILDRLNLDDVVARVDLNQAVRRVDVDEVVRTVDLDAVIGRIDLVGVARDIIDALDLPEIIRRSSGSMASDLVRGARVQSIAADQAVGSAIDRLLRRRPRIPGAVAAAPQDSEAPGALR